MPSENQDIKKMSFEEALSELEGLTEKLNQGGLPLAQATETYERGMMLREHCRALLKEAEDRIRVINERYESEESEQYPDAPDERGDFDEDAPF